MKLEFAVLALGAALSLTGCGGGGAAVLDTSDIPRVKTSTTNQASAGGQVQLTQYVLQAGRSFHVPYEGHNAAIQTDFPHGFFPAVGSGLAFKGKASDGSLEFYGITDRGPNGDSPQAPNPDTLTVTASKMFPSPSFTPAIGLIAVSNEGAVLKSMLHLRADASTRMSGRPLPGGVTGSSGEVPLNDTLTYDASKAGFDIYGIDPESLIYDAAQQVFWTSDEYGPFIAKIDAVSGIILKKYQPGSGKGQLPEVLRHRRANRGMEGLTQTKDGKLHGFLQSPIDPLDKGKSMEAVDAFDLDQDGKKDDKIKIRDFAQLIRWLQFDPATESARLYAYPLHYPLAAAGEKWERNRTGSTKLGDVLALPNGRFLVIEQGMDDKGRVRNFLMLVEIPANATDITADGIELEKNSIDGTSPSAHRWREVVTLKKRVLLDLNAAGWQMEKAEGLTLVDEQTIALINDNDFGLRSVLVDRDGKFVEGDIGACTLDAKGQLLANGKCAPGAVSSRVTRAVDSERDTQLWLLRFPQALSRYTQP